MRIEETDYNEVLKLRQEVMYPDKSIEFVKLEQDADGIHVGIHEKGILVSAMSIFIENRDIQFRKLATKEAFQGKGYASALVKWVLDYAKEMNFNKVWANSRVEVFPLYEKLEFKKTENTFTKNDFEYIVIEYKI